MHVLVLGVLAALSLTISTAHAQQVSPLILNGKPATIQGIGLGDGPESCKGKVSVEEFGMSVGNVFLPNMLLQWCQIGPRDDYLNITLDSSASKVVKVTRHLFLDMRRVNIPEFLASIESFYGPADFSDYRNRLVAYGDFNHRAGRLELQETGVGLVVEGNTCGLGVNCPAAYDTNYVRVTFRLSDQDAFAKAEAEGKQAFANRNSNNANAISF